MEDSIVTDTNFADTRTHKIAAALFTSKNGEMQNSEIENANVSITEQAASMLNSIDGKRSDKVYVGTFEDTEKSICMPESSLHDSVVIQNKT